MTIFYLFSYACCIPCLTDPSWALLFPTTEDELKTKLSISRHPLAPVQTHKKQTLGTEGKPGIGRSKTPQIPTPQNVLSVASVQPQQTKQQEYPRGEFNQLLVWSNPLLPDHATHISGDTQPRKREIGGIFIHLNNKNLTYISGKH